MSSTPRASLAVRVSGVVQGVGFRPFVYRLATELCLDGIVGNDASGVFVELEGPPDRLGEFLERLRADAPPLAWIDTVSVEATPVLGTSGFSIAGSRGSEDAVTLVSPDIAVCDACLAEMWDPANRRYLHPFITCTDCGPRFTITKGLPYDRPLTTMASFALCEGCRAEYENPHDRRYHAQPISCHDCGPVVSLRLGGAELRRGEALMAAREALRGGAILAVKGIGGYHLVCDATSDASVGELRARKGRPDKPFAVMVRDLPAAHGLAFLDDHEIDVLSSKARPIVLARSRPDSLLSALVAPGSHLVGVMLAYTPLHHLLFAGPGAVGPRELLGPLVVTSDNVSGEPICYRDDELEGRLGHLVDGVLSHDRPIHVPCDDSVVRVSDRRLLPLRRSRGYAPLPLRLPGTVPDVLAVGAELKNAFCVASGSQAWMSQHIGDMGNLATLEAFEASVGQFCELYRIEPSIVAVDAHPGYLSSRWARGRLTRSPEEGNGCRDLGAVRFADTWELVEVQHHHAHVASVMAEHGLDPLCEVIGLAFDGTGYGDDGTIWGGEILEATAVGYRRVGHLGEVLLPGGDASVRHPWRAALAHLHAAGIGWGEDLDPVRHARDTELRVLARQLDGGIGCVPTTSMGRLFDAAASILGLRHEVTYEAQAAIELEHAAAGYLGAGDPVARVRLRRRTTDCMVTGVGEGMPPLAFGTSPDGVYDPSPVVAGLVYAASRGVPVAAAAAAFHLAVAEMARCAAVASRDRTGCSTVVMSGGVWQNVLLAGLARSALIEEGFDVLTHQLVPPNDGGLALGQVLVSASRTLKANAGDRFAAIQSAGASAGVREG